LPFENEVRRTLRDSLDLAETSEAPYEDGETVPAAQGGRLSHP
jgi:hypothetical protein